MNTNTTRKTRNTRNTNTNTPAPVDVTATLAALAEQIAALTALVTATPAPAPAPASVGTPAPAKAKAAPAKDKAKQAKAEANKAKANTIKAAREAGASMPYEKALSLAAARIVHNRKQAGKGATHVNASIFATSPASVRVWLTSAEHQAYKAARDVAGIRADESESNLVAAIKKVK